jgi:hypothetical protein
VICGIKTRCAAPNEQGASNPSPTTHSVRQCGVVRVATPVRSFRRDHGARRASLRYPIVWDKDHIRAIGGYSDASLRNANQVVPAL